MNYLPEDTSENTPAEPRILPGMPNGPDILDTSALRTVIPAFIARIAAMVGPGGVDRGAIGCLWGARRLFAQLFRAEKYNLEKWLTNAMRADPVWQTHVREDLGGEKALLAWEARLETARLGKTASSSAKPAPKTGQANTNSVSVRTDRHNMFRLAPIAQGKPRKSVYRAPLFSPDRNAWIIISPLAPIPLTPDQLRAPEAQSSIDVISGEHSEEDSTALVRAPSNCQAPTREAIMSAWYHIYDRYCLFNFKIMNLDLMMNISVCRRMPLMPV